jgi:CheY-like chemotaxis protein
MTHTVLLVEDEEDLRETMREALEAEGYTVVAACEGEEALAAIQGIEHLCLVLLDLLMPGMNGWDFFAALRALPGLQAVPVIVHTSAPSRAPIGVTRVLQKPLKLDRLLEVVHEYCAA